MPRPGTGRYQPRPSRTGDAEVVGLAVEDGVGPSFPRTAMITGTAPARAVIRAATAATTPGNDLCWSDIGGPLPRVPQEVRLSIATAVRSPACGRQAVGLPTLTPNQ